MFFGDFERVEEFPDSLQPSEDGVLPAKRMLPEEDLECGLILVLVGLEVCEGAGELIEVVVEDVNVVSLSMFHEIA